MAGDRGRLLVICTWAAGVFPDTIVGYRIRDNGTYDDNAPMTLDSVPMYDKGMARVRWDGITEGTVDAMWFDEAATSDADANSNVIDRSHIGDLDGTPYAIADVQNGALTNGRNVPTGVMGAFQLWPVFVTAVGAEIAPGAGTVVEFLLKD